MVIKQIANHKILCINNCVIMLSLHRVTEELVLYHKTQVAKRENQRRQFPSSYVYIKSDVMTVVISHVLTFSSW